MDNSGNVAQNGEENVDAEIAAAAPLEEDTQRREDHGEDDLADVASGEGHGRGIVMRLIGALLVCFSTR